MKISLTQQAHLTYFYLRSVCGFPEQDVRLAWNVMQRWQFEELALLGYQERNKHLKNPAF